MKDGTVVAIVARTARLTTKVCADSVCIGPGAGISSLSRQVYVTRMKEAVVSSTDRETAAAAAAAAIAAVMGYDLA